jgi:hypothetical protein
MAQEEWAEPIEDSDHAALVPTAIATLVLKLALLTSNPVHERRRQHIQIVTSRPMIVHIPATIPIIPPMLRSELLPPLPVLAPPPLALLLLIGEVEGVEEAAAAGEADVDAAFPFPQTDCPPSPAYTISAVVSCRAPGAYSVHMV